MKKSLIIVESPTKIKTLQKFLGPDYIFESSVGHIIDLPPTGLGINIEQDFSPDYVVIPDKKAIVKSLQKAAKGCETIYLCPDPDREGEAIAWHIASILPKDANIKRVTFNSITKQAVVEALEHPREIDTSLVNAQQARRILDRLVGYKITPILLRRVVGQRGKSVSAGRVQSVALKLVVEREKEIRCFISQEYWNLTAKLHNETDSTDLSAYLYSIKGKKVVKGESDNENQIAITNEKNAHEILYEIEKGNFKVDKLKEKLKYRHPTAPFITSTLQQEASRHHNFSASRTMGIAQSLYEGIDMDNEGSEGLITYMRTDSIRVAPEAIQEARSYIESSFGKEYLPLSPRIFATKKGAQDAHEAIRPTNLMHPPEKIKSFLNKDQFLVYSLIWNRFVASQMNPAQFDTVSANLDNKNGIILRLAGSRMKFDGFLKLYEEKHDEEESSTGEQYLPQLKEGEDLNITSSDAQQAFTKPPARFSEASLVKELEKSGIGRPSTYAAIMNKIQGRDYTIKENSRLVPTELGEVVTDLLKANFNQIMDTNFTAEMEDKLERVAEHKKDWREVLKEFWTDFVPALEKAEEEAFVPKVETDIKCPKCGENLQKIWSRSKYFYGCSAYPECDFSVPSLEALNFDRSEYSEGFDWDQVCSKCGKEMTIRHGRYGAFLGCSAFPECRSIVNIPKEGEPLPEEMPSCPAIGCEGNVLARRSRFGKIFYSCSCYPDCDIIVNDLADLTTKYIDHPKTAAAPKKKKATKKSAKKPVKKTSKASKATKATKDGKITKKRKSPQQPKKKLDAVLQSITGETELSRPEITKKIWDYIKSNERQNPDNKRQILPDDKLAKFFGTSESIDMMQIAKHISSHLEE